MSSPDERAKRRARFHNRVAKDLKTGNKYRQRVKEDKTRKVEVKDLTHADLVKLINSETEDD